MYNHRIGTQLHQRTSARKSILQLLEMPEQKVFEGMVTDIAGRYQKDFPGVPEKQMGVYKIRIFRHDDPIFRIGNTCNLCI